MRVGAWICALAAVTAVAATGQRPATIVLKPATARLSEEFTMLSSVRELSDGRVLISDEKDKRIVIADFKTNRVAPVGRLGDGPGEYQQPGQMYAFGGDTTVVGERFLRRWTLLAAERYLETIAAATSAVVKTGGWIQGADAHGNVVALTHAPGEFNANSVTVVRYDRGRDRLGTLAKAATMRFNTGGGAVGPARAAAGARGGGSAATKRTYVVALQVPDQIAMFADGWVAIAHERPYHVDWYAPPPATRCTAGAPIVSSPPMTAREKTAYLEWVAKTTKWPPTTDVAETVGWPNYVPPFVVPGRRVDGRSVFPALDGRLVIERLPSIDQLPMQYDIIDRRGALSARMTLPQNQRIVGFGAKSAYIVVIDNDDIQRLERHPWP